MRETATRQWADCTPAYRKKENNREKEGTGRAIRGRELQSGDHVSHGVVEDHTAVQVGLPVLGQDPEIILPAAFIEAFADRVGYVTRKGAAGGGSVRSAAVERKRANHFAGCIEKQRMPEIARNWFFALPALAKNSLLHGV